MYTAKCKYSYYRRIKYLKEGQKEREGLLKSEKSVNKITLEACVCDGVDRGDALGVEGRFEVVREE